MFNVIYMRKLGIYSCPDIKATEALEIAKMYKERLGGKSTSLQAFAQAIGHSTSNSGGFIHKLSDLKTYGLVEGRGQNLELSQLAIRILMPIGDDKEKALRDMVFNIPLWKALYQKLDGKSPSGDSFMFLLLEITKAKQDEIYPIQARISKLYIDAMSLIKDSGDAMPSQQATQLLEGEKIGMDINPLKDSSTDRLTFTAEGIVLKVRNDEQHLEKARAFIDLWMPEKEGKKKKES